MLIFVFPLPIFTAGFTCFPLSVFTLLRHLSRLYCRAGDKKGVVKLRDHGEKSFVIDGVSLAEAEVEVLKRACDAVIKVIDSRVAAKKLSATTIRDRAIEPPIDEAVFRPREGPWTPNSVAPAIPFRLLVAKNKKKVDSAAAVGKGVVEEEKGADLSEWSTWKTCISDAMHPPADVVFVPPPSVVQSKTSTLLSAASSPMHTQKHFNAVEAPDSFRSG